MRDLLHSVASLSRAGKEPTYRKTNQDNCFVSWKGRVGGRVGRVGGGWRAVQWVHGEDGGGVVQTDLGTLRRGLLRTDALLLPWMLVRRHASFTLALTPPPPLPLQAYSQYCRPNQALLAALDGHGPHGHSVRRGGAGAGCWMPRAAAAGACTLARSIPAEE